MALFKPVKTTNTRLSSLSIKEGQLILVTDTKKLYFDISSSQRILVSGDSVVSFSVSGSTVTFTRADGTTGTFTIDAGASYTAGAGIDITNDVISNKGVRGVSEGATNGTISVNTNGTSAEVAVHGLGSLAYKSSLTAADVGAIATSDKGANSGVAELDSNGKVPTSQLPSYVDDVIEGYYYNNKFYKEAAHTTEIPGEAGKIYIDLPSDKTYRWGGTSFIVISETLSLGETSTTAYRGDRGKIAYDHSQTAHARADATKVESSSTNGKIKINGSETTVYTHPSTDAVAAAAVKVGKDSSGHVVIGSALSKSDVGLGNVGNFKAVSTVASQGLSETEKSNARTNIGAGTSNLALGTTSTTAAAGDHTHTTSLATDTGTSTVSLSAGGKYKLTAGGTSVIFTMPSDSNSHRPIQMNGTEILGNNTTALNLKAGSNITLTNSGGEVTIKATDTTYSDATTSAHGLMTAADKTKLNNTNVAFATCSTAAATAGKEATIDGNANWVLDKGSLVFVKFTETNTASNPTLNIGGTGAKSIYYNTSVITTGSLNKAGYANRYSLYMYDGTNYVFAGWSVEQDTTYSPATLGQGYGTCSTAADTAAKVVTLSNYALVTGGIVSVKFTNAVPASATMNINSRGAKNIYYKGVAITAGVIKAGDVATFIYSGQYHLISIDRWGKSVTNITRSGTTFTMTYNDGTTATFTQQDNNTTYTLTQDSSDGHKLTFTPSSGTATNITIPDNNTTYTFASGDSNGQIAVTPSGGTKQNVTVKGINNAAYKDVDTTIAAASTSTKLPTSQAVASFVEGKGYTTNTGTVTKVSTGAGLTGGDVTTTGTIKADLKSETKSTLEAAAMGSTANKQYAVGLDKNGKLSVNIPWTDNNTTYSLTQDGTDGHKITLTPSSGTAQTVTIPDNNTTYSLTADTTNNKITLTPSSGTAQSITVPYATSAGSATTAGKATNDSDGNAINSTYLKKSGGAMTGAITRALASSGTVASTNLFTVTGSTDGFKVDYASTTADLGITTFSTTDDANAKLSLGNTVSSTYKEAIGISNGIPTAPTATAGTNNTQIATTAFVQTAIDNLPDPMVFKGSLGTDGTITALPVDGSASVGDTYKVITAGTYASKAAKVGDTFICLTKTSSANTWELIPSGDDAGGTVTSVTLKATSPIAIDSTAAITTSGTRTLSHANSGVTAGTYRSVTVNATGHVTAGTNPTTLSGYGITDAKIASGVITLGSNTITPLTASSTLDATKLSGTIPSSCYTDTNDKVTQTNSTTDAAYRLVLSATADDTTRTEKAVKSTNFRANPSTGALYAKGYDRIDITGQTLDLNTLNLSAGSPNTMHYIEKTNGGSDNISNKPVASVPFLLDVDVIRWASTSDYITRQIYTNANNPNNSYVRYCTSGTWGNWTTRVYTNTTYSAGQGLELSSTTFSLGHRWNAITQGQKWSRICLITPNVNIEGTSGILSVSCTRDNVVCNATFLVTTHHSQKGSIMELASSNYSALRLRLVVDSNGKAYIEIYDTANSIASGTTQTWHCTYIPLLSSSITKYTAFTDGTTVPSGYTAVNDFTITLGDASSAIKNITRSGTTFTATRQNGTTFTFTQQDNNHIPAAYCSTAATEAAKAASHTSYVLLNNSYELVTIANANTSQTALTLNINGKGAKPIYINGSASSTTNYTLPAGTYLVFYDGTNYYFRTDGKITGNITGSAASATKATQDGSGNTITDTYVKKAGDTMSGNLTIQKATPTLTIKASDTTDAILAMGNSQYTTNALRLSSGDANGGNLVVQPGAALILSSGEAGGSMLSFIGAHQTAENIYSVSDNATYIDSNAQTFANRVGFMLNTSGELLPTKADVATTGQGNIGNATYQWNNIYGKTLYENGTSISSKYVAKSGDTMTGALTISKGSITNLIIDRTDGTNGASIQFKNTNGVLGAIGMTGAVNGGLTRWTADYGTAYTVLDTGNYSTTLDNRYVKKAGDTMTGDLLFANSGTATRQVQFKVGDNDYGRLAAGATAANAGWLEIATADDYNEPIYARQYSGAFATLKRTATLLDASGNTTFPQKITTQTGELALTSAANIVYNSTDKCIEFNFS